MRERNKKICERRRRILTIPIIVEPIVVPVQSTIVPIQVTNIQVVVRRVPKMYEVSSIPPLIEVNELSLSCIEFCILNTITPNTKYFYFFKAQINHSV